MDERHLGIIYLLNLNITPFTVEQGGFSQRAQLCESSRREAATSDEVTSLREHKMG